MYYFNLATPLLGIYPEKTIIRKDTCTPVFLAALAIHWLFKIHWLFIIFIIAKAQKQTKCPLTEEWIKMWYVYICNEILLSHKKNAIMPFVATCIDLKINILNEVSQTKTYIIW